MTALDHGYVPQPPPPRPVPPVPDTPGGRVAWTREWVMNLSIRDACDVTGITRGDWQGIEADRRGSRWYDNMRCISEAFSDSRGRPLKLGWLLCEDVRAALPFPRNVTGSNSTSSTSRKKRATRADKVYCSTTSASTLSVAGHAA